MKRNYMQRAVYALGLLVLLLSACAPLLTPAQQTAVAATGQAAANGLLTPSLTPQMPATTTPAATAASGTAAAGVPATGGTPAAITSVPSASATNGSTGTGNSNGTSTANESNGSSSSSNNNGSNGSSNGNGSNGTSGSNSSSNSIPNTGGTSAGPTTSLGASGCQGLLTSGSSGPLATLWINNNTGTAMNFTMGIPTANTFGQCGFLTFGPINPGKTLRVRVPVTQTSLGDACYWAFATPVKQGHQTIVNGDNAGYCITTPTRWVMNIRSDRIRLAGQ